MAKNRHKQNDVQTRPTVAPGANEKRADATPQAADPKSRPEGLPNGMCRLRVKASLLMNGVAYMAGDTVVCHKSDLENRQDGDAYDVEE